jgi:hypothetical protein
MFAGNPCVMLYFRMDPCKAHKHMERRRSRRYSFRHHIFLHFNDSFPISRDMLSIANISDEGIAILVSRSNFPMEKLYIGQKISGFVNILGDNLYHVELTVKNVNEGNRTFGCTWSDNCELSAIVKKLALHTEEEPKLKRRGKKGITIISQRTLDKLLADAEKNKGHRYTQ